MDLGSISTTSHCPTSSLGVVSMGTSTHVNNSGHSRTHNFKSTQHSDPVNPVQSSPSTDRRINDSSTNTLSLTKQLSNDGWTSFEHTRDPMDETNDIGTINGNTGRHIKSRFNRNATTCEPTTGGPLHQANNRIRASIQFRTIREEFLEIRFSLKDQRIFIFSCHPTVYKLSFILQNLIPLRLSPHLPIENKLSLVIIPRVNEPQQPTHLSAATMMNVQQQSTPVMIQPDPMDSSVQSLTSHWDNTFLLAEQPSPTPPMIILL